jgi:hypothetical protein
VASAFRRYLAVMAVTWAIAAAAVIGFNLLVDAMGILPVRLAVAGFNEKKPLRAQYDWIVKRFTARRLQPTTIFAGSSRIKNAFDPGVLAGTAFAPAYNGALDADTDLRETRPYLARYLAADGRLRYAFVEAYATALLAHSDPRLRPAARTPSDLGDLTAVFFSMDGLLSAIRTVALNRTNAADPVVDGSLGFAPYPLPPNHFSVKNVFNFIVYTPALHRDLRLLPSITDAARGILEDCQARRVQCRFFLSPEHADFLAAAYYLGLWPELERLKRALAALGPTYDFTRYNRLIDERRGPVVYWREPFHFSPALGELMQRVLTDARTADMPENFGVVVDAQNIEANLAAWRDERDAWMARNPDALRRMRLAEDNRRRGVSFEDATAAELAAGGF